MAISAATILAAVNSALRRSETDIAEELMETLENISMDIPVEASQESIAVSEDVEYTAFPSLMIWFKAIWRPAGNVCNQILHNEFLGLRANASSLASWAVGTTYSDGDQIAYGGSGWESLQDSNTGNTPSESAWWTAKAFSYTEGEPTDVAIFDDKFWWYPMPDADYTFYADVYKLHAHTGATGSYADHFYTACKYGTIWKVALKLGLPVDDKYFQLFEIEKNRLSDIVIIDPPVCKYQQ